MNPNDIELENLNKSFEYVKFCGEIEKIDNIEDMKNIAKCYFKLYLKQQEVFSSLVSTQP